MRVAQGGIRAIRQAALAAGLLLLTACAYEIGYQPMYLPSAAPSYVAQGKLLAVMPEEQRAFTHEGPPSSRTGDYITLVVPIGNIVQQIASHVFGECFIYGVEFAERREGHDDYVLALEGDMQQFIYAYDRAGEQLLDKVYDSGVMAGEEYLVTSKPAERINRVLHATLHNLMLQLVADVRPLLMERCQITDVAATGP